MLGINKKLLLLFGVLAVLMPAGIAYATPSSVDRITDHIEPLIKTDFIKGAYFVGTTTATSTLAGGIDISHGCFAINGTCLSFSNLVTSVFGRTGAVTALVGDYSAFYQPLGNYLTAVSVNTANGFAGASSGGTTPALTLSTTVTGVVKGNGMALSAAANGTDYTLITAKTCTLGDFVSAVTAAGVFTCTTPAGTTYTGTYPILVTGSVISTAFSTTTSNTFAGTQTFTNSPIFSMLGAGTVNSTAGGAIYNTATSTPTVTAPITYSGILGQFIGGIAGAFGCNAASGSQPGCLSSADWTLFNNKISSSSLSGGTGITYTPSTGVILNTGVISNSCPGGFLSCAGTNPSTFTLGTLGVANGGTGSTTLGGLLSGNGASIYSSPTTTATCTGSTTCSAFTVIGNTPVTINTVSGGSGTVTQVNTTYPVTGGPITTTGTVALAFGTTTSNTWALTQTFTNSPVFSTLTAGTINSTAGGTIYNTPTTSLAVSSPLTVTGTLGALIGGSNSTINCQTASGSQAGCLSSTDFNTFNNKQAAGFQISTTSPISQGNLAYYTSVIPTSVGGVATGTQTISSPLTGGPFTVLGSGGALGIQAASAVQNGYLSAIDYSLLHTATTTFTSPLIYTLASNAVTCQVATGSVPGCLSAADFTTFNGKQAAGNYITALTGDVTATGPGSVAATLATVNSNVGTFTNSTVTVNAKGLVTAVSSGTVSANTDKWATSTSPTSGIYPNSATFVGIGTTTPRYNLQLSSSTAPQLALTDGFNAGFGFRNSGGALYIATTSATTFATTSMSSVFAINGIGAMVGIQADIPTDTTFFNFFIRDQNLAGPALTLGGNNGGDNNWILRRFANNDNVANDRLSIGTGDQNATMLEIGTFTPSGRLGIGTTTPRWALQSASSTAPQLALTFDLNSPHWTMNNIAGNLFFATSSPTTFATSTTNGYQGFIQFPARGGCIGCSDILLTGGVNLLNAKYLMATSSAFTANVSQDIYTVPTGRRAILLSYAGFNNSGAQVQYQAQLKTGGSYYNIAGTSTLSNLGQAANGQTPLVLEPGDSFAAISSTTVSAAPLYVNLIEYDSATPLRRITVVNALAGNGTFYTPATGISGSVLGNTIVTGSSQPAIFCYNDSGGSITVQAYYNKPGVPINNTSLLGVGSAISNNNPGSKQLIAFAAPMSINSGDSLSYNLSAGMGTKSICYIDVYEH